MSQMSVEHTDAEADEFKTIYNNQTDFFYPRIRMIETVRVKTGLPNITPMSLSQHEMFVPVYWDVNKRLRFIDYVKLKYPIHEKKCREYKQRQQHLQKMANFNQRMEKEKEFEIDSFCSNTYL